MGNLIFTQTRETLNKLKLNLLDRFDKADKAKLSTEESKTGEKGQQPIERFLHVKHKRLIIPEEEQIDTES